MTKTTAWYRKGAVLFFGGLLAASSLLFVGCGGDSGQSGSSSTPMTAEKAEDGRAKLSPYISATNQYNGKMVTFAFSIQPSLEELRSGEQMTHISLPDFDILQKDLKDARQKSSGFDDVDKAADEVLASLKDLAPLATKMEGYYSAKTYLSDGYAQAEADRQQYLPLYDKFAAAYESFNSLVDKHNEDLQAAQLEAMKKAGKKNTAIFLEIGLKASHIVDELAKPTYDAAAVEQQLKDLESLNNALDSEEAKSYKRDMNSFIGEVREYLASGDDAKKFNDMVEEYNDTIDTANRMDTSKLDSQK